MKIAIVSPDDFSVWHFRKELLVALKERGFDVYVISDLYASETPGKYARLINNIGATHIPIKMGRFMSPVSDLRLLISLYKVFRSNKFDIVHNFTIKPNIYGSIAARIARINKVYNSVTGLGFVYSNKTSLKLRAVKPLIEKLYRLSCKLSDRVWFQNKEDLDLFVETNMIDKQKALVVRGSGVNLSEFSESSLDVDKVSRLKDKFGFASHTKFVIMAVARVIWSKGVKEFIEASERLKRDHPSIRFILVGPIEKDSPLSVSEAYLRTKEESGNFHWLGFRSDIREILALSDLVVLPSFYREGVPRVLLEAMALGKPIVTTDNVGCREVVDDAKNGYLIPVRDSRALSDAIELLLNDDIKRESFGKYSRMKVEKEFDEKKVVEQLFTKLYQFDSIC